MVSVFVLAVVVVVVFRSPSPGVFSFHTASACETAFLKLSYF